VKQEGFDHLTTRQAGELLRVCERTAARLFDDGELRGFRMPHGRRDRRISRPSVLELMTRIGIPLPEDASQP
jgi:excisionase family DNA binding protein